MKQLIVVITALLLAACADSSNGDSRSNDETRSTTEASSSAAESTPETPDSNDNAGDAEQPAESDVREPEETREPNAPQLEPAFPEQTRAPKPADTESWNLETLAERLDHPWALEFLPDGHLLITERSGALRHVTLDGEVSEPIEGVPTVHAQNQGGLLDVVLSPDFAESRLVYLSYAEPVDNASRTAVARGRLSDDARSLENVEVIFRQDPSWDSRGHFGSRLVFHADGTLFVTLGDRMNADIRTEAQNPMNHIGTVVRINTDGTVPDDNPFADGEEGAPEVWSYGHRNIQSAAMRPGSDQLWTVEHGPRGGDELNNPQAGLNYGWPTITHGIEYSGEEVGEGIATKDSMEQPVYYWDPVIAPSGMIFYTGDAFPGWQGDAFVGGLATRRVSRLVLDGDLVAGEEWLTIGERVRDVTQGPDGAIYLVTDEDNGKLMRIVPTTD